MRIIEVKDYQEMSEKAGEIIISKISRTEKPVLGLATGSTPEGLYRYLIEKYKQDTVSFADASSFNLDEYVGMNPDDENSYHHFMMEKLFNHIDIPEDQIHLPNGVAEDMERECRDYERRIRIAGQVDIQILGLGVNGHIGFNEPGTSFSSRTHIVDLDESTREANARFFNSIEEVPTQAITMGIETIMESREILLLVSGEPKAEALKELFEGQVTEEFPASILKEHANVTVIADQSALSKVNPEVINRGART